MFIFYFFKKKNLQDLFSFFFCNTAIICSGLFLLLILKYLSSFSPSELTVLMFSQILFFSLFSTLVVFSASVFFFFHFFELCLEVLLFLLWPWFSGLINYFLYKTFRLSRSVFRSRFLFHFFFLLLFSPPGFIPLFFFIPLFAFACPTSFISKSLFFSFFLQLNTILHFIILLLTSSIELFTVFSCSLVFFFSLSLFLSLSLSCLPEKNSMLLFNQNFPLFFWFVEISFLRRFNLNYWLQCFHTFSSISKVYERF